MQIPINQPNKTSRSEEYYILFSDYQLYIPEKFSYYGLEHFPKYLCNAVLENETIAGNVTDYLLTIFGQGRTEQEKKDILTVRRTNWRKIFCQSQHDLDMAQANTKFEKVAHLKDGMPVAVDAFYHIHDWVTNESWFNQYYDIIPAGISDIVSGEKKRLEAKRQEQVRKYIEESSRA